MSVNPYLSFEGRADEAIEFYRSAVGAEVVMLMRFKDAPPTEQCMMAPESADKVMHAALKIAGSDVLVTDGRCTGNATFTGTSLTLTLDTEAAAKLTFAALSDGGQPMMPLGKTFFAAQFGMVTDKFGVPWMILFMG